MCFSKITNKLKIAEKDIPCYKFLRCDLKSPFEFYQYVPGAVNTVNLDKDDSEFEVEEGYHSCKTLATAIQYREEQNEDHRKIYEFYIPKGAEYYENETQYVSNQIVLKSEKSVEEPLETA